MDADDTLDGTAGLSCGGGGGGFGSWAVLLGGPCCCCVIHGGIVDDNLDEAAEGSWSSSTV